MKKIEQAKREKMSILAREKERYRRRFRGEETDKYVGECTMPGCHIKIFSDCEYLTDDSQNIFCSAECVFEYYGIKKIV